MRRVYHGGIEIVEQPLVHIGRDNLDFGKGFYVTNVLKQAKIWAQIKSRYYLICILNQEVVDKYLIFEKSTKMKG